MPSLESVSGGPFPSLVKLDMLHLPCLGEVWMVAEGRDYCNFKPQLGQVQVGNCLTELKIQNCPKLEVKPHLPPSLQHLQLWGNSEELLQSPGQFQGSSSSPSFSHLNNLHLCGVKGIGFGHGWELLEHLTALDSLGISRLSGVQTDLPESLWSLTSLRSLQVHIWNNIRMLPKSLGELRSLQELTIESCASLRSLPQSMGQLTSLQLLRIALCDALQQLPECLGELCSLRELEIMHLPKLTCLPQSMCRVTTSLEKLEIFNCPGIKSLPQGMEGLISLEKLTVWNCPGIQSLPEGIKGLTALKELWIYRCPDLERRCERGKGEDWHLISHSPNFRILFMGCGHVQRIWPDRVQVLI